ncbi:MAG: cytochrome b/b6 domain-containing protein [Methylorubrum populi]
MTGRPADAAPVDGSGALRGSERSYGRVARAFHWTTAAPFLCVYCAVYYRHRFTDRRTPANWTAPQFHLSFGISISGLTTLRVTWMLVDRRPAPEPDTKLAQRAAHMGHLLLYAVLIVMPGPAISARRCRPNGSSCSTSPCSRTRAPLPRWSGEGWA